MLKLLGSATAAAVIAASAGSFGQTSSDWWTHLDLTAVDVGEAVLPWTTHPGLQDEESIPSPLYPAVK
jgi:hypothetical protein